jgi:hypothetical protein
MTASAQTSHNPHAIATGAFDGIKTGGAPRRMGSPLTIHRICGL